MTAARFINLLPQVMRVDDSGIDVMVQDFPTMDGCRNALARLFFDNFLKNNVAAVTFSTLDLKTGQKYYLKDASS